MRDSLRGEARTLIVTHGHLRRRQKALACAFWVEAKPATLFEELVDLIMWQTEGETPLTKLQIELRGL